MLLIIFCFIAVIIIIGVISIIVEREIDVDSDIVGIHMEGMVDVPNTHPAW
jgi:hypothetical protein